MEFVQISFFYRPVVPCDELSKRFSSWADDNNWWDSALLRHVTTESVGTLALWICRTSVLHNASAFQCDCTLLNSSVRGSFGILALQYAESLVLKHCSSVLHFFSTSARLLSVFQCFMTTSDFQIVSTSLLQGCTAIRNKSPVPNC